MLIYIKNFCGAICVRNFEGTWLCVCVCVCVVALEKALSVNYTLYPEINCQRGIMMLSSTNNH